MLTRWLVLSDAHSGVADETPRLCRKNAKWVPEKVSGPIEGAISTFEEALRVDFFALKNARSSNFMMV